MILFTFKYLRHFKGTIFIRVTFKYTCTFTAQSKANCAYVSMSFEVLDLIYKYTL